MSVHKETAPMSQFTKLLNSEVLEKIYKIKDSYVQRSFYKMLASIAQNLSGNPMSNHSDL